MSEPRDPAPAGEDLDAHLSARSTRYGLRLFWLYVLLYAGFMALAAFSPALMASTPVGGVTLAVLYGLGLIVSALILAGLYMYLCRRDGGQP